MRTNYKYRSMGADVEFFFKTPDGIVVPSDRHLPTKRSAMLIPVNGKTHINDYPKATLHVDGIQGELTVAPGVCRSYIMDYLRSGLMRARSIAEENGLVLSVDATVDTPKELLDSATPEGVAFGCDPDYSAWNGGSVNINEIDPNNHFKRYAGCHIHVETKEPDNREATVEIVQLMDIFIGVPMVLLERNDPLVTARRHVFGKAGVFRYTNYGVEYRVPSANMLVHPFLYHMAFSLARFAVNHHEQHGIDLVAEALEGDIVPVIMAINDNDPEAAWHVMERAWKLYAEYYDNGETEKSVRVYNELIHNPDALTQSGLVANWQMDFPYDSYHGEFDGLDYEPPAGRMLLDTLMVREFDRKELEKPVF